MKERPVPMKHFNSEWPKIRKDIGERKIFLFLDFDGTLAPIEEHPDSVFLSDTPRNIIEKLSGKTLVALALISGRGLADLEKRVGVADIIYAGNHGLEVKGPFGRRKLGEAVKAGESIRKIKQELEDKLSAINNVLIEDKGLTLSVHYRMVREDQQQRVVEIFNEVLKPYNDSKEVRITRGKKVLEIRPPVDWHKGKIVNYLLKRAEKKGNKPPAAIYIGDDVTDEDAFREINAYGGYSVRICDDPSERTEAEYFLKDPDEVTTFLAELYITERVKGELNDV